MLPLYPFIVYLCAAMLPSFSKTNATKIAVGIPSFIFMLAFPVSFLISDKIPYSYDNLMVARFGLFSLSMSGMLAILFLKNEQIQRSLITLCTGMFCVVFAAWFTLPQFDKVFGFRRMAVEASSLAQKEDIDHFTCYKFPSATNMDIYLGKKVNRIISLKELNACMDERKRFILFVRETEVRREPEFGKWLEAHQLIWHEGRYRWYIIAYPR